MAIVCVDSKGAIKRLCGILSKNVDVGVFVFEGNTVRSSFIRADKVVAGKLKAEVDSVSGDGVVLVDVGRLWDVVKKLDGEVKYTFDTDKVKVEAEKMTFEVATPVNTQPPKTDIKVAVQYTAKIPITEDEWKKITKMFSRYMFVKIVVSADKSYITGSDEIEKLTYWVTGEGSGNVQVSVKNFETIGFAGVGTLNLGNGVPLKVEFEDGIVSGEVYIAPVVEY